MVTSPLPSQGAQKRAEWVHNPCRPGGHQQGDKIRSGYITFALSMCQKKGRVATSPLPSGVGGWRGNKGTTSRLLHHVCLLLKATKRGRSGYIKPAVRGVPNKGTKSKMAPSPLLFQCDQKRAEWLHSPCRFGVPNKGTKSKMAASPYLLPAPKRRQNGYITPAISGSPTRGKYQKQLRHLCSLKVPKRGRSRYIAPAVSGVPNTGRKSEVASLPLPSQGCQQRLQWLHNP